MEFAKKRRTDMSIKLIIFCLVGILAMLIPFGIILNFIGLIITSIGIDTTIDYYFITRGV